LSWTCLREKYLFEEPVSYEYNSIINNFQAVKNENQNLNNLSSPVFFDSMLERTEDNAHRAGQALGRALCIRHEWGGEPHV
jgi:hypothetical protein